MPLSICAVCAVLVVVIVSGCSSKLSLVDHLLGVLITCVVKNLCMIHDVGHVTCAWSFFILSLEANLEPATCVKSNLGKMNGECVHANYLTGVSSACW